MNVYKRSVVLQVFAESLTGHLLSTAAAHTFTNGRTRYSQQTDQRRERAEERGEVCMSGIYTARCIL